MNHNCGEGSIMKETAVTIVSPLVLISLSERGVTGCILNGNPVDP